MIYLVTGSFPFRDKRIELDPRLVTADSKQEAAHKAARFCSVGALSQGVLLHVLPVNIKAASAFRAGYDKEPMTEAHTATDAVLQVEALT